VLVGERPRGLKPAARCGFAPVDSAIVAEDDEVVVGAFEEVEVEGRGDVVEGLAAVERDVGLVAEVPPVGEGIGAGVQAGGDDE